MTGAPVVILGPDGRPLRRPAVAPGAPRPPAQQGDTRPAWWGEWLAQWRAARGRA